jgi:acyl transferase domain-containing protein
MSYSAAYDPEEGIAIVGMAGRFPGAHNVTQYWQNLLEARETISHFRDDELEAASAEDVAAHANPAYVRARGILDDIEMFDADFFGIGPKEADLLDPQHRIFMETAWEALEDAGYDPQRFTGLIGVFAGVGVNIYYLNNLLNHRDLADIVGWLTMMMSTQNDFLSTRVAYKLDLKGPALNIQTACSTSLVTVCSAAQSLLSYQCDMALAGGVTIELPQRRGYLWQEGMIVSRDGHCRAFDSDAQGTVSSNGVGLVVLRRLRDARADGDHIYAVIKGAALNNDGSSKVSFSAPSVDGQAQVIAMAQAHAGIDPETISYIEAHGTGTQLGDPAEIAGLTQAFRAGGAREKGFCAIGSVKTNIGHADKASGVAGLIKTALALHHKLLPASLHFKSPNPKLDLENTPFYVNARQQPWNSGAAPRRAGVSSFGVGGTNAHVVLEEAPAAEPGGPARNHQLLVFSARSAAGLDRAAAQLKERLAGVGSVDLADVAYTLQVGRRAFSHRRALVCRDRNEAIQLLAQPDPKRVFTGNAERQLTRVAFLFPGQGAQSVNMGRTLYDSEATFRKEVDECAEVLRPHLGMDLRTLLYPPAEGIAVAQEKITQTAFTQPALFVIEYALARLWMSWGIEPAAMIGHSLGEYVAACLAGVFSRDVAATLVAARGRLLQQQPRGAMMAVRMAVAELEPKLTSEVVVAGINAPELTVVAGPDAAVRALQVHLGSFGVDCRLLATSHAFHSPMMDGAIGPFREVLGKVTFATPQLPWVSSLTGDWITPEQAVDPEYWLQQLRRPVRFSDGVHLLGNNMGQILLEVGPGHTLSSLVRQHRNLSTTWTVVASLGSDPERDVPSLLEAAGRLWVSGAQLDWPALHGHQRRHRVSLPTYPFERRRHWIDPLPFATEAGAQGAKPVSGSPPAGNDQEDARRPTDPAAPAPATSTSVAGRLQALLETVSGIPASDIDVSGSFLDLGLDSMLLTQVSVALMKSFNIDVPFRLLLEDLPTPSALAAHIEARLQESASTGLSSTKSGAPGNLSAQVLPVPGARLGRDAAGNEAWFVPDPDRPGKYLQVTAR